MPNEDVSLNKEDTFDTSSRGLIVEDDCCLSKSLEESVDPMVEKEDEQSKEIEYAA